MFLFSPKNNLIMALLACFIIANAAQAASNKHRAEARLFGAAPMKGKARYEERIKNGQPFKRFKVEIEKALPFQTFDILVNGSQVGTLTTNVLGRGKFQLRTAAFIDSPGDGQPIPADFPKLDTGDVVSVGPLTGTIFDRRDNSVQRVRLRGKFDDGQIEGKAEYRERFKNSGLERRFQVEIEDAPAGVSYDILVNGQLVGTLVTGSGDETKFQLRTAAFIDSPGDGDPMPNSFPTIKVDDLVTIGPHSVTMKVKSSGGGN